MKVSIIIPTYKDIVALKFILTSLEMQTFKNFEVMIAEDDNSVETKDFLNSIKSNLRIQHFSHEDKGNRKAMIMNKVLLNITSDYIIFIDGDCIPYSTFIESHVALAKKKTVLCGRRVNLGDKVSEDLRTGYITSLELEKSYLKFYKYLIKSNTRHYEQGFRFSPCSLLYNFISSRDKNLHIVGSNFSCYKEDLDEINGFDEDIIGGSKDDVDLEWRFLKNGCELKSCKFCANLFHLSHERSSRIEDEKMARQQMESNKNNNNYRCKNGIYKK